MPAAATKQLHEHLNSTIRSREQACFVNFGRQKRQEKLHKSTEFTNRHCATYARSLSNIRQQVVLNPDQNVQAIATRSYGGGQWLVTRQIDFSLILTLEGSHPVPLHYFQAVIQFVPN